MSAPRKIFVTTALPYANGSFHVGHIMEYIQADIWVRYQRMQGHAVNFVGADDAHGAPIMIAAEKAGKTPEQRERTSLRPIDVLVIAPSQRIDDIAARHLWALPPAVRAMLRAVGVYGEGKSARGAALASYLLFEAEFTRELIQLGHADTLARRGELCGFFGWTPL